MNDTDQASAINHKYDNLPSSPLKHSHALKGGKKQ